MYFSSFERITITNAPQHRNKLLYDDYVEHKPGSLKALQEYLNTSAYRTKAHPVENLGDAPSNNHASRTAEDSSAKENTPDSGDIAHQAPQGNPPSSTKSHDQANTHISPDTTRPPHLFPCTDKLEYGRTLHQDAITNVKTSLQLFEGLRKQYLKHRGDLRPYWSFRTISQHSLHVSAFLS